MRFRRQEASRRHFFTIFSIFGVVLEGPRPPQMEPKSLKNAKNRRKNDVKKNIFYRAHFYRFLSDFGAKILSKMDHKWRFFDVFFENVDFVKYSKNHSKTNGF